MSLTEMEQMMTDMYRRHDADQIIESDEYFQHIDRLTRENLRSKSEIAQELAARDRKIAGLKAQLAEALELLKIQKFGFPLSDNPKTLGQLQLEFDARRDALFEALSGNNAATASSGTDEEKER